MVDHIKEALPEYSWIHNRVADTSCHRYRPDLRVELGDRLICIECDEHQHMTYECDVPRMVNITQDIGLPTVFIRWNPDKYEKRVSTQRRLERLVKRIRFYLELPIDKFPQGYPMIEYMFYDKVNIDGANDELTARLSELCI